MDFKAFIAKYEYKNVSIIRFKPAFKNDNNDIINNIIIVKFKNTPP